LVIFFPRDCHDRGSRSRRSELIDATVGEVGGRLHLAWWLRLRPAPFGIGDGWHVIEQQAYADTGDSIESLDLLCSGFRPEADTART
jgi:hypothetical protein